jgi:mannose-6-phosphate isomerase-like protein (cupin superfamily)
MRADPAKDILRTCLHVQDNDRIASIEATDAFCLDLAAGMYPDLDRGRLMSAFTFTGAWETWERHPTGEELVMLLAGAVTLTLEEADGARSVHLTTPGSYVLIAPNTWHTAAADTESTLVFLTPGAGTEHRPV